MKHKQVIRLSESKLRNLIREAIEEANEDDNYFVKIVECYDEDDSVFVAALTKNGMDEEARKIVERMFPNLEIVSIADVSGCIEKGDMTEGQFRLYDEKAVLLPDDYGSYRGAEIEDVNDLDDWI